MLQLPAFDRDLIVECDTLGSGFGAVLHQGAGPIAFFSKSIAPHHAKLAAYKRELIGLVQAVRHWRPYLWGRRFVVRPDHQSLRFLLDQRLMTIPYHQWRASFSAMISSSSTDRARSTSWRMPCLTGMKGPRSCWRSRLPNSPCSINGDTELSLLRDAIRGGA